MYAIKPQQDKCKKFTYYRGAPPPIDNDAEKWFDFTDHDHDGKISQEQVIISICAKLRPDNTQRMLIRRRVQDKWGDFDKAHKMKLTKAQFMDSGIVKFISDFEAKWLLTYKGVQPKSDRALRRRASIGMAPSLNEKPQKWFEHYDTDHSLTLSQAEVFHGLFELLIPKTDAEKKTIRETIENCWNTFDLSGEGVISKWEFLTKGGLADFLVKFENDWKESKQNRTTQHMMNMQVMGTRRHSYLAPPNIHADLGRWFDYFDIDYSGHLTQGELITGLFVSLNASSKEKRDDIRKYVISIWNEFDMNDNHFIDRHEFVGPKMMGEHLSEFAKNYDTSKVLEEEGDNEDLLVNIKVYLPEGSEPGKVMKVSSPVSHEVVLVMIPEKLKWGGGNGEPNFFTVKFIKSE